MKNLSQIVDELDLVTKQYVDKAAEAKVDKVEGKQLSTNDFTNEEKEKLNSLQNYTLPVASADALGGVKIGNNLSIDDNGALNINKYTLPEIGQSQNIKTLYGSYTLTTKENAVLSQLTSVSIRDNSRIKGIASTDLCFFPFSCSNSSFYLTVNGVTKKIFIDEGEGEFDFGGDPGALLQQKIDAAFGEGLISVNCMQLGGFAFEIQINNAYNTASEISVTSGGDTGEQDALALLLIPSGSTNILNTSLTIAEYLDTTATEMIVNLGARGATAHSINPQTMTIEGFFNWLNNLPVYNFNITYRKDLDKIILTRLNGDVLIGDNLNFFNALGFTDTINGLTEQEFEVYKTNSQYYSTQNIVNVSLTQPDGVIIENISLFETDFTVDGNLALAQILQKENTGTVDYIQLENKPTLNGVAIEGDKTGTDYGINDTNVYYGEEEPTADNVVMWIDPTGTVDAENKVIDKYHTAEVTYEQFGVQLIEGDIVPKIWAQRDGVTTYYRAKDGTILTCSSVDSYTGYALYNACDGQTGNQYRSNSSNGSSYQWCKLEFIEPKKITKMYMGLYCNNYFTDDYNWCKIQGSNDNNTWTDLFTMTISRTHDYDSIVELANTDYYKYYRIYVYLKSNYLAVKDWYVVEYEGIKYDYINNIDFPIQEYENDMIIKMRGNSYFDVGEVKVTNNLFPTQWNEETLGTKYNSDNGYIIEGNTYQNDAPVYQVVDGQDSTYWSAGQSSSCWMKMTCPEPQEITKMIFHTNFAYRYVTNFIIQGSNDNTYWYNLHNLTSTEISSVSGATGTITISKPGMYKYYKISITLSSSFNLYLYEWQVAEFVSLKEKEMQNYFINPYLNIKDVGITQINGVIEAGKLYTLHYNGQSWDILNYTVMGQYTGNSSNSDTAEQSIILGFNPKILIVINPTHKYSMTAIEGVIFGTNGVNQTTNSDGDLFYKSTLGGIQLIENGFKAIGGYTATRGFNYSGTVYRYIAMK